MTNGGDLKPNIYTLIIEIPYGADKWYGPVIQAFVYIWLLKTILRIVWQY